MWDVVSLTDDNTTLMRVRGKLWDKEIPHMKEIVRKKYEFSGWTDLLDPDAKPYLIRDQDKNYHILFWKAWFEPDGHHAHMPRWSGSDWYDSPPTERNARRSKHWPVRVWELHGVEYNPRKITDHKSPIQRLLDDNKVKKYKSLASGLVAIRKRGEWHYYRFETSNNRYVKTGSTQRLER